MFRFVQNMNVWLKALLSAATILGFLFATYAFVLLSVAQVEENKQMLADHEARLKKIESVTNTIEMTNENINKLNTTLEKFQKDLNEYQKNWTELFRDFDLRKK